MYPHRDQMDRALAGQNSEAALELILSAWQEGTESGIDSELMAYAALYAALSDLVGIFGEEPIAALSEGLAERIRSGEFTFYGTTQ
jgi:hypothetical protein